VLISLFQAAIIEGFAIAPLVIPGMGHAGSNGFLGYLSMFVNMPGLFVAMLVTPLLSAAFSILNGFAWLIAFIMIYVTQVSILGYVLFIRRMKIYGTRSKTD
jgi:hypothetical protein